MLWVVSPSIIRHPSISSQPSQRTALYVLLKLYDPKLLNVCYCRTTEIWGFSSQKMWGCFMLPETVGSWSGWQRWEAEGSSDPATLADSVLGSLKKQKSLKCLCCI